MIRKAVRLLIWTVVITSFLVSGAVWYSAWTDRILAVWHGIRMPVLL